MYYCERRYGWWFKILSFLCCCAEHKQQFTWHREKLAQHSKAMCFPSIGFCWFLFFFALFLGWASREKILLCSKQQVFPAKVKITWKSYGYIHIGCLIFGFSQHGMHENHSLIVPTMGNPITHDLRSHLHFQCAVIYCIGRQRNHQETENHEVNQAKNLPMLLFTATEKFDRFHSFYLIFFAPSFYHLLTRPKNLFSEFFHCSFYSPNFFLRETHTIKTTLWMKPQCIALCIPLFSSEMICFTTFPTFDAAPACWNNNKIK